MVSASAAPLVKCKLASADVSEAAMANRDAHVVSALRAPENGSFGSTILRESYEKPLLS